MNALSLSHGPLPERRVDQDLRGYLGTIRDIVTWILDRLAKRLSPAQIVGLACVAGFWKFHNSAFHNSAHDRLQSPVEAVLAVETSCVTRL